MLALYGWALEDDRGGDAPARLLARRVAAGLPFAAADGGRLFDPAEAVNAVIAAGLAGAEPDWRGRFVETARLLARTVNPAAPGEGPVSPRAYSLRFSRSFDLRGHDKRARLRVPCPLESGALTGLSLGLSGDGAAAAVAGRIERQIASPVPDEAALAYAATFTSRPAVPDNAPLVAEQRTRWLAPDEGLVQVTRAVRVLADRLAASLTQDRAVVQAFHDHLLDDFCCGIVAYEAIAGAATDHVIASGWYDCQLGAALLVALCRARGIPARLVGGYLLAPAVPTPHFWCEAWAEGWRPFDLLGWDLSAGGRDRDWRGTFAGRIDHRMTTQILPDIFTGATAPALPVAHHRIATQTGDGVAIDHVRLDGRTVYRDRIAVKILAEGAASAPASGDARPGGHHGA